MQDSLRIWKSYQRKYFNYRDNSDATKTQNRIAGMLTEKKRKFVLFVSKIPLNIINMRYLYELFTISWLKGKVLQITFHGNCIRNIEAI